MTDRLTALDELQILLQHTTDVLGKNPVPLCEHPGEAAAYGLTICIDHPHLGVTCPDCSVEHCREHEDDKGRVLCILCAEPKQRADPPGNLIDGLNQDFPIQLRSPTGDSFGTLYVLVWCPLCIPHRREIALARVAQMTEAEGD